MTGYLSPGNVAVEYLFPRLQRMLCPISVLDVTVHLQKDVENRVVVYLELRCLHLSCVSAKELT